MKRATQKFVKSAGTSLLSTPLRLKGFSRQGARLWVREKRRSLRNRGSTPLLAKIQSLKSGHLVGVGDTGEPQPSRLTHRDYLSTFPMNRKRWRLRNRVATARTVPGFAAICPIYYCTVRFRNGSLHVVRLINYPNVVPTGLNGLLDLIVHERAIVAVPLQWDRGVGRLLEWDGENFTVDGWPTEAHRVLRLLEQMASAHRILLQQALPNLREDPNPCVIRLYLANVPDAGVRVVDSFLLSQDSWVPNFPTPLEVEAARREGVRRGWAARPQRRRFSNPRFGSWTRPETVVASSPCHVGENVIDAVQGEVTEVFSSADLRFKFITVDLALTQDPRKPFVVTDISDRPQFPVGHGFSDDAEEFLDRLVPRMSALETVRETSSDALRKVQRKRRTAYVKARAFKMRAQGFTGGAAYRWARDSSRGIRQSRHLSSKRQKEQALKGGFLPSTVARFGIDDQNVSQFVSEEDYHFAHPLNGRYGKWVRDRVSSLEVFHPFAEFFEPLDFQFLPRDDELQIVPLSKRARAFDPTVEGVVEYLRQFGPTMLVSSVWDGSVALRVEAQEEGVLLGEHLYSIDEMEVVLRHMVQSQFYVMGPEQTMMRGKSVPFLSLTVTNPSGSNPLIGQALYTRYLDLPFEAVAARGASVGHSGSEVLRNAEAEKLGSDSSAGEPVVSTKLVSSVDPADGTYESSRAFEKGRLYELSLDPESGKSSLGRIRQWDKIAGLVLDMARFAPQLKFLEATIALDGSSPRVMEISPRPRYGHVYPFSPAVVQFLREHVAQKKMRHANILLRSKRLLRNTKLHIRRGFAEALYPRGLVPYQSVRWLGDVRRDLMSRNGVPLSEKVWAYRHGFLSYRLPQYGITPDNWQSFISDLEYRWLRHINKKYKYWLEDKISIKYIADDFSRYFPEYYYYVTADPDGLKVVPMMDLEDPFGASFGDLLDLVRLKNVVALKPEEGSHGDGFYRLESLDERFFLNGEEATEEDVRQVLSETGSKYLVTEFVKMHPELARVYPDSVNTVRLIVFKRDGVSPQIGNAYLRIGSSESGFVDNTSKGGLMAEVDIDTGRFGNGQALKDNLVVSLPVHPDTGENIEGVLPDWDKTKEIVLQIASALPQLEYLGFDVAITEDGIKLPEINRFPDYPRINKLTPETIEYLLYKVKQKKKDLGYDSARRTSIISLPPRTRYGEGRSPERGMAKWNPPL